MAKYKDLVGTGVVNFAGEYTGSVEGQLWYNSSEGKFQYNAGAEVAAWSTANDMNQAGVLGRAGSGPQTSTVYSGGDESGSPEMRAYTETWNGTNWTEVNDLGTARAQAHGAGVSSTAAIAAGGFTNTGPNQGVVAVNESWNGTNWTEVNDLNTQRRLAGACGSSTSALVFGGQISDPSRTVDNESWNGTNWTELNNMNTMRFGHRGAGTANTAGLAFGGQTPPGDKTAETELWNGTNWTEVNDLNTARYIMGAGGTSTSALAMGGATGTGVVGLTESWNGTNWTEEADMTVARYYNQGNAGSSTSGLFGGGYNASGSKVATTEAFSLSGGTKTITTS